MTTALLCSLNKLGFPDAFRLAFYCPCSTYEWASQPRPEDGEVSGCTTHDIKTGSSRGSLTRLPSIYITNSLLQMIHGAYPTQLFDRDHLTKSVASHPTVVNRGRFGCPSITLINYQCTSPATTTPTETASPTS